MSFWQRKYFRKLLIILSLFILLNACVHPNPGIYGGTATLKQLQMITDATTPLREGKRVPISAIRLTMLKDTALSLGARSALFYESQKINTMMQRDEDHLDTAYNFYGLLLPHDILPPVLEEGDNSLHLASPDTIRLSQKIYRIDQQARFVTAPPTWRDYILMGFKQPKLPDKSLLPKDSSEREVWNYFVQEGWYQGITQADNIYQDNVNRLNHDYQGMILYRKLYLQNMVSAPFVAKTNLGITGNGNHMRIDDQVLRITALPQLNLRGSTWRPAIIRGETPPDLKQGAPRSKFG